MTEMHQNDIAPVPPDQDLRRTSAVRAKERVEWVVHDVKTGAVLRAGKSSRENMTLQSRHEGEAVIETTGHGVTVGSHQVDLATGALVIRVKTLDEARREVRRELDQAFHGEVEASWRAWAHSLSADPTSEHQARVGVARQRLAALTEATDAANTPAQVLAIDWSSGAKS